MMDRILRFAKNNFITLIGMTALISCNKSPNYTYNYDNGEPLYFHYVDSAGNTILFNGKNGYFKDSVRLYDLTNNIKSLITVSSGFNSPYGYSYDTTFIYRFNLVITSINRDKENTYSTTIIHLKNGVDDTLRYHVIRKYKYINYDTIWYNGINVTDSIFPFTIKKY